MIALMLGLLSDVSGFRETEIICSAGMTLKKDDVVHSLVVGENRNAGIVLRPGNNEVVFSGTGCVLVDYTFGKSL